MATDSKAQTLDKLFKENGLLSEDVHKHQHYTIINRMGIEKIQAKNGVSVHYEPVVMERDFCVIKGIFKKEGLPDLETFGSASKETSQNKYYPEMAEKRCLSRGVLKICKFYELGVFGEDEADDFKLPAESPKEASKPTQEQKQPVTPATPASATEAVKMITPKQKFDIDTLLKNDVFSREYKVKVQTAMNDYSFDKANEIITVLKKTIDDRENKKQTT